MSPEVLIQLSNLFKIQIQDMRECRNAFAPPMPMDESKQICAGSSTQNKGHFVPSKRSY